MEEYNISHLDALEAEAIHIFREVAAEFERPVILFSGGKDSILLVHLALKAFRPGKFPFPIMHVDTGHNFPEVINFRNNLVNKIGERLVVASVEEAIEKGIATQLPGVVSRNKLQSPTLVHAIEENKFDSCFGGGRRDEEKARAKERIYSHRDEFGGWDPKNQRPELWNLYNAKLAPDENMRIFPISNWTEMDVWQYIKREDIELPPIYFTHKRDVFERDGQLLPACEYLPLKSGEKVETRDVRFRTVGCMVVSGAVESRAETVDDIIAEVAAARISERGGRADDKGSEAAMEERKKEGYF